MSVNVLAVEYVPSSATTYCINEYEMYNAMISQSDQELIDSGMNADEVEELRETTFEEMLLERASLPESELSGMGYTSEEISLLKEYDGKKLTAGSAVLLALADCTGEIYCYTSQTSSTSFKFRYSWEWDKLPISHYKDMVAVNWQALSSSGTIIGVSATSKVCKVWYYSVQTGARKTAFDESLSMSTPSSFSGCSRSFNLTKAVPEQSDGTISVYAKEGHAICTVVPDGSTGINKLKVYGAYGHAILTASISISYSGGDFGFSFTPSSKVSTFAEASSTIKSNGTVTNN